MEEEKEVEEEKEEEGEGEGEGKDEGEWDRGGRRTEWGRGFGIVSSGCQTF